MWRYNKLWLALVLGAALVVRQAYDDNHFSPTDWVLTINGALAAVATFAFPNTPVSRYVKAAAAALLLGGGVLAPALSDGWQLHTDLWPVVIAVLEGVGVLAVKNAGTVNGVFPEHAARAAVARRV